jgi:hypothetical protein
MGYQAKLMLEQLLQKVCERERKEKCMCKREVNMLEV